MAKSIKISPECIEECRKEFEQMLTSGKLSDGKICFSKTIGQVDRKAQVFFSEMAYLKMSYLLKEFDKEVAWHATAYRLTDKETGEDTDNYVINDILVYPQEVTATTVSMDTEKYAMWLMENYEDERFNNIRAQMHSHVNIGVTPSAVDLTHQEEILSQLGPEDFYIFMIWNKRMDVNIRIFDMKKNVLFETADVKWTVLDGEYGLSKFISNAKGVVTNQVIQYSGSTGWNNYNQGYGRNPYYTPETTSKGITSSSNTPYNPIGHMVAPGVTTNQKTNSVKDNQGSKKNNKNNKNDKKKDKKKTKIEAGWAGANACDVPNEYDDGVQMTYTDLCGNVHDMSDPFDSCDNPYFQIT